MSRRTLLTAMGAVAGAAPVVPRRALAQAPPGGAASAQPVEVLWLGHSTFRITGARAR